MNVLVTNWRDIKHPKAGGAEVFTHEVLKRLVDRGHEIILLTAAFDGCDSETIIDGVRILRSGTRFTVYRAAKHHYRRRFMGKIDAVIDEINTRPFMTPTYVEEPIVALIHQLAQEFWFSEMPFPIDWLGYHWLEDRWLKRYVDVPTMTVSESTKQDLVTRDFTDVSVVPQGLSVTPVDDIPAKPTVPMFAFVGRMTEAKQPDHALAAFEELQRWLPDAELHMIGDGYLLDELRAEAGRNVRFHGYVPEEEKLGLLKQSHALLVPSVREGWGLVVTEANAMGTPAVGYDVPGLRDSITDGETGRLAMTTPESLARATMSLLDDWDTYARNAIADAKQYSWERTTDAVERQLQEVVQ